MTNSQVVQGGGLTRFHQIADNNDLSLRLTEGKDELGVSDAHVAITLNEVSSAAPQLFTE